MRLVIAVVERKTGAAVLDRLRGAGYAATRLASTGGFLQKGNVTLFTGVEDEQVDGVLEVLHGTASSGDAGAGVVFVTRVADFRRA
jgi:uncharacterized protein YaaQ